MDLSGRQTLGEKETSGVIDVGRSVGIERFRKDTELLIEWEN